jgi:hypothetical protein
MSIPSLPLNRALDRLARAEISVRGASYHTFHVCGITAFVLAAALGATLAPSRGLSPWIVLALALASAFTALALAMLTKIVTGEERLVYYHHQIAIAAAATLFLRILNLPVLPYLDITILGVGVFLVGGRVGCFMVGCCHGKPHRLGVRYRHEHADAGFSRDLVAVRLFPIQLLEALCALAIVIAGSILLLRGAPPGAIVALYAVTYGLARFLLELGRGDAARPYLGGFSEAQWISLFLLAFIAWAGYAGLLPLRSWHLAAAASLALTMIAVAAARRLRRTPRHRLLHARHIEEIAAAVARASGPEIQIARTSLGIKLSASRSQGADGLACHYALSREGSPMTKETAEILAALLDALTGSRGSMELIEGGPGVFHVLRRAPQALPTPASTLPS